MASSDIVLPSPIVEEKELPRASSHVSEGFTPTTGDPEKAVRAPVELKRKLKSRHLQMIAIGGTIGTGLFIGSGGAIAKAGPIGALIAYSFVGTLIYSVMCSLGELATYMPISGAFTGYATRFIDPSLGFSMGWIYWFSWAMTYSLELCATGLIIQYWNKEISLAIPISIFWVVITCINFLPVAFYGEFEFVLSLIKVLTVIGFILFAICTDLGTGQDGFIGFDNWRDPGAFAPYIFDGGLGKFVGFWAVLIQAGFSFQGTELVGISAAEVENPRKNVPAAIKKTFWRILLFFVLTVLCIGLVVPYDNLDLLSDDSDATASPFVIAANLAGVKALPAIINSVLLFVVLSAANSNVYSGSRILLGLANDGSAPAIFAKTSKFGVPYVAVGFTSIFGLLAFMNMSTSGGIVFGWLLNVTAVAGFITWACINACHIAFMRILAARGISRDTLPFKSMWQPWFAWYGLFFNLVIIVSQGFTSFLPWDTYSFVIAYVSLLFFVILYVGHKICTKDKFVNKLEADIDTGAIHFDETIWEAEEPKTWYRKVFNSLFN